MTTTTGNSAALRPRRRRPLRRWAALLATVAVLAVGCGGNRGTDPNAQATPVAGDTQTQDVSFGSLPSPFGPGDAAGYQGAPGLNHEMADAVKAMIGWCNDQGGINGRTVVGKYYDAQI